MLAKVNTIEGVSVLKVGKITICCFFHALLNGSGVELGVLLKAKLVVMGRIGKKKYISVYLFDWHDFLELIFGPNGAYFQMKTTQIVHTLDREWELAQRYGNLSNTLVRDLVRILCTEHLNKLWRFVKERNIFRKKWACKGLSEARQICQLKETTASFQRVNRLA